MMPTTQRNKRPRGWKFMKPWQRKEFHRENESRERRGLPPLPKPTT